MVCFPTQVTHMKSDVICGVAEGYLFFTNWLDEIRKMVLIVHSTFAHNYYSFMYSFCIIHTLIMPVLHKKEFLGLAK